MMDSVDYRSKESQEALRLKILEDPEEGWKEFFCRYGPLIRNIVRRLGFSQEDQNEVYQEVSHNLIRNNQKAIREWTFEKGSLANYIGVISARTAITFSRSAFHRYTKRTKAVDPDEENGASVESLIDTPARSARQRLHRILLMEKLNDRLVAMVESGKVREEDYHLLALRLNGLHYKEIEAILGIPVETLTSRFTRLKPILAGILERLDITPADLVLE